MTNLYDKIILYWRHEFKVGDKGNQQKSKSKSLISNFLHENPQSRPINKHQDIVWIKITYIW